MNGIVIRLINNYVCSLIRILIFVNYIYSENFSRQNINQLIRFFFHYFDKISSQYIIIKWLSRVINIGSDMPCDYSILILINDDDEATLGE